MLFTARLLRQKIIYSVKNCEIGKGMYGNEWNVCEKNPIRSDTTDTEEYDLSS